MNVLTNTMFTDTIPQIANVNNLLVMGYDKTTQNLTIREEIDGLIGDDVLGDYSPIDRILPLSKPIPARKLVE